MQHIPADTDEVDIETLVDHLDVVNHISIVRNHDRPQLSYAWIEITCDNCTQAGLNAICDLLNHRYFRDHPIQAYPVLFSHH